MTSWPPSRFFRRKCSPPFIEPRSGPRPAICAPRAVQEPLAAKKATADSSGESAARSPSPRPGPRPAICAPRA
eukprot:5005589-Heterocapsa_arctica.AAC.1